MKSALLVRDEKDIYPIGGGQVLDFGDEFIRVALPVRGMPQFVL